MILTIFKEQELKQITGGYHEIWCYYGYSAGNMDLLDPSYKAGIGGSEKGCPSTYQKIAENKNIKIITSGTDSFGRYIRLGIDV